VTARTLPVLTLMIGLCSCGSDTKEAAPAGGDFSGLYDVGGFTEEIGSGESRALSGTVVLRQEGDAYHATFELDTEFPFGDAKVAATVIGQGDGAVKGSLLTGETRTQVVVSTVPGVDPGFAFIPRMVTTKLVSSSKTRIEGDGSVTIELQTQAAPGETYIPTRTKLKGVRVALQGQVPPPIAAAGGP
jgi:hypothetical protein